MSAPTYDEARAEYQRRYTEWHRLQHQWAASWRNGGSPGIALTASLSLAERELRAASGAMHRAAASPSRAKAPVCPTIPKPHARITDAVVHLIALTLAGLAGALLVDRH